MAFRPREGGRDRDRPGGRRRGALQHVHAPFAAALVDRRSGRGRGDRGRVRVARPRGPRSALQPLRGPPAGPHTDRGRGPGAAGRRRRGRRARGRRVTAHNGRECVCERPWAHEACRPLRHPAGALQARPGRPRRRARARARQAPRRSPRDAVGRDRGARRHVRRDAPHPPLERARRHRAGHAGLAAGIGARAGAGGVRAGRDLEPALTRRREPRRRLLARADERARRLRPAGAASGAREHRRPGPARRVRVRVRHASHDDGAHRHRARVRARPL